MAKRLTADERRAKIIEAARTLFAEQGFEATRVEDIAEAAGCSTGPVYHFFGTKRDIYAEALQVGIEEAADRLSTQRASGPSSDPEPTAIDRLIRSCEHLLGLLSLREVSTYAREAPNVLGIDAYRELYEHTLVPYIERDLIEAIEQGEIEPEPTAPLAIVITAAIVVSASYIASATSKKARSTAQHDYTATLTRLLERLRVN